MSSSKETFSERLRQNASRLGWTGAAVLGAAGLGLLAIMLTEHRTGNFFEDNLDDLLQGEDDWLRDLVERA